MKGTYNIDLKLSTESKECTQKVSQKVPRICQCNQLHKFTTFDTNIASEVKIRLDMVFTICLIVLNYLVNLKMVGAEPFPGHPYVQH